MSRQKKHTHSPAKTAQSVMAGVVLCAFLALLVRSALPANVLASSFNPTLLVNTEAFAIIDDSDTTANVRVQFGDTLLKTLSFNRTLTRFEFNDDVFVSGGLQATGSLVWNGAGSGRSLDLGGGNLTVSQSGAVVINEQSRNVDTRIEGDTDANVFFVDASTDRIGIGTIVPETKFDVVGTISGSSLTINGSAVSYFTGSVGIGTTSPDTKLEVVGTVSGSSLFATNSLRSSGSLLWEGVGSGRSLNLAGGNVTVSNTGAVVINQLAQNVDTRIEGQTDPNLLYIDASVDKVGIGTAAPQEKLDVDGNILIGAQEDGVAHTFDSACNCILNSTAGTFDSDANINGAVSAVVYNGAIYLATAETNLAAVYRFDGGTTWTKVSDGTSGKIIAGDTANIDRIVLTVYNGRLYAGTQTAANTGALYEYDGTTWTLVNATRGTFGAEANIDGVSDIHVWNSRLYVGSQETNLAGVYRYDGSTTFTRLSNPVGEIIAADATDLDAVNFISYNGRLYVGAITGASTARVFMYDGNAFTLINTTRGTFAAGTTNVDDVTSMIVYNGQLIIGTGEANLANIYVYKGGTAGVAGADVFYKSTSTSGRIDATADATDIDSISMLRVYNGRLYAGSNSTGLAALYEYVGDVASTTNNWVMVNSTRGRFGAQTGVDSVEAMVTMNGVLYVGTNDTASNNGSMYSWSKTGENSYGLKFTSTGTNIATISFIGEEQSQGNSNHTGMFTFTHPINSTTGSFDYAEDYPTYDYTLMEGDVVGIDSSAEGYVKRADTAQGSIGVYSANPGFRLQPNDQQRQDAFYVPIALMGRVPVNVNTENGPILPGDMLTLSSTPGVAMKATKAGMTIGRAMAGYNGTGIGKVLLFVDGGWYGGTTHKPLFDLGE